jgi:hypothetical protein
MGELTSGEVIGRLLDPGHTLVETCIPTESGAENAVLESRWVLQVNVQLTVQALVYNGNSWANGCDVGVEDQCEAGFEHICQR